MSDQNVAFIDIGTNSIRLLLTRVNKSYTVLSEQKEVARLGEGEFPDGLLQKAAMDRAVMICREFAEMARANRADEIIAVATSATREAKNKNAFLRLLRKETGLDVHPISGLEEARLIYLGVVNGIHLEQQRALFIDIGGGSTEVIVGDHQQHYNLESLKLGAIRMSAQFAHFGDGPISSEQYQQMQDYVRNSAVRAMERIRQHPFDLAYGSSGTIENLGDIAMQMFAERPREREDVLKLEQLEGVVAHLCSLPVKQRGKVKGINSRRADIIVPGAAILHTLMLDLGFNEIHITDRAMREGMLIDYLIRHGLGGFEESLSVRKRSVMQLAHKMQADMPHAYKVAELALSLYDSAAEAGLHSLGGDERELLEYAAILHDIGIFLAYDNHQAHSHYLIQNADLLGFDEDEIDIIAATSYFHRKYFPRRGYAPYDALEREAQPTVKALSILLRIAEALDRGHKGIVHHAYFEAAGDKRVELHIESEADWQLEAWGLGNHRAAFKRIFGSTFKPVSGHPTRLN